MSQVNPQNRQLGHAIKCARFYISDVVAIDGEPVEAGEAPEPQAIDERQDVVV